MCHESRLSSAHQAVLSCKAIVAWRCGGCKDQLTAGKLFLQLVGETVADDRLHLRQGVEDLRCFPLVSCRSFGNPPWHWIPAHLYDSRCFPQHQTAVCGLIWMGRSGVDRSLSSVLPSSCLPHCPSLCLLVCPETLASSLTSLRAVPSSTMVVCAGFL